MRHGQLRNIDVALASVENPEINEFVRHLLNLVLSLRFGPGKGRDHQRSNNNRYGNYLPKFHWEAPQCWTSVWLRSASHPVSILWVVGLQLKNLNFQLLYLSLLRFDCLDQQGRESGIVHALNLFCVRVSENQFGHNLVDVFSNNSDFVLSITLAPVGNPLQLLDGLQSTDKWLDIGLEPEEAASDPRVSKRQVT